MVYEDEKQDFNNWCANYFGSDSDEQYVFDAVEKCPVVERLRSRIAELEKDAERYRWLLDIAIETAKLKD